MNNTQISKETLLERDLCLEYFGVFLKKVAGFRLANIHIEWSLILDGRAKQEEDGTIRTWFYDDKVDWEQIMLMAPRNHGKSTIFSVFYPLWLIAKNPNIRIIIVSNTSTQAKSFLRQITKSILNCLAIRYLKFLRSGHKTRLLFHVII